MKGNGLQTTRIGEFHVEARVALVITRRVSLTAPGDASLTRGRQVDLGRELSHSPRIANRLSLKAQTVGNPVSTRSLRRAEFSASTTLG